MKKVSTTILEHFLAQYDLSINCKVTFGENSRDTVCQKASIFAYYEEN